MSSLTPQNAIQVPQLSDVPDIETSFGPAFTTIDSRLVSRFTSPADRDARVVSAVAGMICYVASTGETEIYNGTKWVGLIPRIAYESAGQTVTDSVTLANSTNLKFAVEANCIYRLSGTLRYKSNGTASNNIKMGFTAPSGANGSWSLAVDDDAHTTADSREVAYNTSQGYGCSNAYLLRSPLTGILQTFSTAGTLQFQFAENASIGGVTSVEVTIWSSLELLKIG